MGGGPEIPAELMMEHLDGPEVVKSSEKENRKQGVDAKAEKEKGKITENYMGKDERQEGTGELIEGKKEDRKKREGRDEGKEKRKVREEERSKEDKKRKERAMDGGKKGESEERERGFVVKDKMLEEFDGKVEVEDGKKQKVKDKWRKDHMKEGSKERQQGEGEGHKKDRSLDKNKRHTKEKDRYNVEKLKKKLAKLDAKLDRIMAKRKDYFLRLKEAESSSATEFEITDNEPKDPNVERLANDMASMTVSGLTSGQFPEVITREDHNEFSKRHSEGIVYPQIEQHDITGVGF